MSDNFFIAIYNGLLLFISLQLAFLGISSLAIGLYAFLLLTDFVFGLIKAYCIKDPITSSKMKWGVISKLSLLTVPIILGVGQKAVGMDLTLLIDSFMVMLVFSEVYSILGNINTIKRGKNELPEFDAISIIAHKIRDFLIKISK